MNFDVRFKSLDHSHTLVDYVEERFARLAKYEIKPITVHVTFSQERHQQVAEVYIKGLQNSFRARGVSDSLYVSLDMCMRKLKRQMEKEKSKIKHHHHYEHSAEAQLEEMAWQEEWRKRAV